MSQIALAQKPLQVSIAGRAYPFTAQRGPFLPITPRIGFMALQTMLPIDLRPGGNSFRLRGQRIDAGMIAGRNMLPART